MEKSMKVYSKNNCPQCESVKNMFKMRGIHFEEINMDHEGNEWVRDMLKSKGATSAPFVSSVVNDVETTFFGNPASKENRPKLERIIEDHDQSSDDDWDF